jgi:outer membrane murein-binding lipoprotein Lpp
MKKTFITLAVVAIIIAGSVFTGCKSSAEKELDAQTELQDAQDKLDQAQTDANAAELRAATEEEWVAFKSDAESKIRDNEIRIAELTVQMNKPGALFDAIYKKRILTLEQQNRDLRVRIDAYDRNSTDWETFKREFNHDMDEIGNALKDLTVDNKK